MSGHSKWATIKRKKGAADAKRGKIFSKLIKEITIAARLGGGDPSGNSRLRQAIDAAKAQNMPQDNVNRAIKRGTGEMEGVSYEESTYEGYGPGGVAMLIQVLTDNKNRTVAEIRHLLSKGGGNMGESGSVAWIFQKKGAFNIDKSKASEDEIMEATLEAGVEDIQDLGDVYEVTCPPENFDAVQKALQDAG
ncbi:MAG: YebC/PmpR family DNA-binding transcriptional regulator, partial [bacterium]|nr:YebC/PmpR family DNA-binding transcriptional regulator [bacterium]